MSKHRRPAPPPSRLGRLVGPAVDRRRLPQPLGELLLWSALACAVVPLVLVWSGSTWAVALGVGALLVGLVAACGLALRLSKIAVTSTSEESSPPAGPDA